LPAQSCGYCDNLFCCCHRFVFLFPFVPSFSACRRVGFYVRYPTAEARTANKEPPMKFYEIPKSVIPESFRQISAR